MPVWGDLKRSTVNSNSTVEKEIRMFPKFDLFGIIVIVGLILFILIAPASATDNWSVKNGQQTAAPVEEEKGLIL